MDLYIYIYISNLNNIELFYYFQVVELGSALLEGGNQEIQRSLFAQLHAGEVSQSFFQVFYDKTNEAQTEIKSTVTVNTSDITAR